MTTATRLALNQLRRREPELASPHVENQSSSGCTEACAARAELAAAVARAVANLPEEQRSVLVLREYHDLDYSEIADVLNLEVGTVKSRLSRARHRMREQLAKKYLPDVGR